MIKASIFWICVQVFYSRYIFHKLVQYLISYYCNICSAMVASVYDSKVNLFLHLYFTELIKTHLFLSKNSFLPSLNFKEILKPKPCWITKFIKSFRFGFLLLRTSHKVLDIFMYILHCYFYIIVCILIQLYFHQILNFFQLFHTESNK